MCWISKNLPCVQIAEKDIPVFKILRKDLTSVYCNFQYNIGETYNLHQEINVHLDIEGYYIGDGFHSYDPSLVSTTIRYFNILEVLVPSKSLRLDFFYGGKSFKIVDCIIPEGSQYYKNEEGEIVSDCIKICKVRA